MFYGVGDDDEAVRVGGTDCIVGYMVIYPKMCIVF